MKPMLPTLTFEVPLGEQWVYETKYDGFRAILTVDKKISLTSRNNRNLLPYFPEATEFFEEFRNELTKFSPLSLDGEICCLNNPFKSEFAQVQTRGRLRNDAKIQMAKTENPCVFLAFDLLQINGKDLSALSYLERKKQLYIFSKSLKLPLEPDPVQKIFVQYIPHYENFETLWADIQLHDGEGIIAKHTQSKWEVGKRSPLWKKYKNWKKVKCFITKYNKNNGYFTVGVFKGQDIIPIGEFKHGMKQEETSALIQVLRANAKNEDEQFIDVPPSICVEIKYLELFEHHLREPYFSQFLLNVHPTECKIEQLFKKRLHFEDITHPEKLLWEKDQITKLDYLTYMEQIYPYMEPFLKNRTLTVIRYPHGTFGKAFYQKNCPDYAPSFVDTFFSEGINYIICNNLKTFMWLANQLAIEFHIPFHTIDQAKPSEIVIDLDPPKKEDFPMAQEAAIYIKEEIVDRLGLAAFIKVSGSQGLQIYFPLPNNQTISWNETRLFTEFVANYVIAKNPNHSTIERLKKKRNNKLYIDYIQHAQGKTIICPFSLRGNKNAGVATPIEWNEVRNNIQPDGFSITQVLERLKVNGNPFNQFFQSDNQQPLKEIINFLKKKG